MRSKLFHLLTLASSLMLCQTCAESLDPGDALLEPQPLVFTASQGGDLSLATRAAADGTWDGDGTEFVAIKIGSEVKKYKVTSSDGALEPVDSDNTFYRSDKSNIQITAWYPYVDNQSEPPTQPSIATDQSSKANREASNLMTASATAKFGETTSLTFTHQTALIKLHILSDDGTTAVTGATVKVLEDSTTPTWITAYNASNGDYSALISPQSVSSGTEFISINADGKNYVYKLASGTTFTAGNSYAYSLTLEKPGDYFWVEAVETVTDGITVSMNSTSGPAINLRYSTDDGSTWQEFTVGSTTVKLNAKGDKVWFKAGSGGNTQLSSAYNAYNSFSFSGKVKVGGDITTLLSAAGAVSKLNSTFTFYNLFNGNTTLISAEKLSLPSTILANCCYRGLFSGCTNLTTAPKLPAETLAEQCYRSMFDGCKNLKNAPTISAKTLGSYCCYNMFKDCIALDAAPALPVEKLENYCYSYMFNGCSSLKTAPELPATTLADGCYWSMFYNCTGLSSAPKLEATSLAKECYKAMFYGCTGISSAPKLEATSLAGSCYYYMFYGCTSLQTAPELPATTLEDLCYRGMFYKCSGLSSAPKLEATTLAKECYGRMFNDCTNLKTAPELPATELEEDCYSYMFYNCKSLTKGPELPATTLAKGCYYAMFGGCTNLQSVTIKATDISATYAVWNWLPAFKDEATNPTRIIYKNKSLDESTLKAIQGGIPDGWKCEDDVPKSFYVEAVTAGATVSMTSSSGPNIKLLYSTDGSTWNDFTVGNTTVKLSNAGDKVWFKAGSGGNERLGSYGGYNRFSFSDKVNVGGDITSLLSADGGISDLSNYNYTFPNLFRDNAYLISAEELSLPSTTLVTRCYYWMFYNCPELLEAPELPATTLASSCYNYMFYGCSKLTKGPVLPAETLVSSCYYGMFYNCTQLSEVTIKATTLVSSFSSSRPTQAWLQGVTSGTGTIYYTNQNFIDDLLKNGGGIPTGWGTQKIDN